MANNILAERKLHLIAPAQPNAEERNGWKMQPRCVPSVYDNQPRLTVYTGVVNDLNKGRIEANMDAPTMYSLLQGIRNVAEGKAAGFQIKNMNHLYIKGQRSEKPMHISTTYVGIDQDDCMYLAVLAYKDDRPKIRFRFGPSEYHMMLDAKGEPVSIGQQSRLFAHGWANMIEAAFSNVLHADYISYEQIKARKEANRQSRGGGGNYGGGGNRGGYNNNGGNGNYNQNSNQNSNQGGGSDDGDNIPW